MSDGFGVGLDTGDIGCPVRNVRDEATSSHSSSRAAGTKGMEARSSELVPNGLGAAGIGNAVGNGGEVS